MCGLRKFTRQFQVRDRKRVIPIGEVGNEVKQSISKYMTIH